MSTKEPPAPAVAEASAANQGTLLQMSMRSVSASPLRSFLHTESASARSLVAAVALALIWANVAPAGYDGFWAYQFPVRLGPLATTLDLREWINSGAMTLFFLVAGLEARREFDLGDLRDHRRLILPVVAGLTGMAVPVLIYLAINHSGAAAHGWGIAMSTDTALALGVFSVAGRGLPDRIRTFVLTVFVVDDVVSLVVIAAAYSGRIRWQGLLVASVAFVGIIVNRRLPLRSRTLVFAVLLVTVWGGLLASGVDPVVSGLAVGLATSAYTPRRDELEQATTLVRLFREQPTPELARSATLGLERTVSANARLQHEFHQVTSFVIVPLFALANAGIVITPHVLALAVRSPITIGIFVAYVAGKPLAVVATSWLTTLFSRGAIRPPVGWAGILGSGAIAGVALTVSLLIADLAFTGQALQEAKLGVLAAAVGASLVSVAFFRLIALLPAPARLHALLGDEQQLIDLTLPVDRSGITSAGPPTRSSRSSSTATSNARGLRWPRRRHGNCSPPTQISATSGGTCRCPTCTPTRSWRPRQPRPQPPRASSGKCTTCSSPTKSACSRRTWSITPPSSAWTPAGSATACCGTPTRRASPATSTRPTAAAWPERRPSSSIRAATTGRRTCRS